MPAWIIILAEAAPQQKQDPFAGIANVLFLIGPFVLMFYLLIWRPQMKKDKERQELIKAVKKNDRVLTNGGIYGVVKFVDEKEVLLRVDEENKVVIRFAKSAIVNVERSKDEAGEQK